MMKNGIWKRRSSSHSVDEGNGQYQKEENVNHGTHRNGFPEDQVEAVFLEPPTPTNEKQYVMAEQNRNVVIGHDTQIKGEIRNCDTLHIQGYVEGITEADTLLVHEEGTVKGTIQTNTAEIHGVVDADMIVHGCLNVRANAVVNGDIKYGVLSVESGGVISGNLKSLNDETAVTGTQNVALRNVAPKKDFAPSIVPQTNSPARAAVNHNGRSNDKLNFAEST